MARSIDDLRKAFPYSEDCLEMQKTIDKVINEKSYYALKLNRSEILVLDKRLTELNDFFTKKNCEMVLGNQKIQKVSEIAQKYGQVDKLRIESENIEQRNKRIYVGIGIIFLGVSIILITNKE